MTHTFKTVEIVADDIAGFSDGDHMYGGDISEMTQLLQDMVEHVNVTIHTVTPKWGMLPGAKEAKVKATEEAVKKVNKVGVPRYFSAAAKVFPRLGLVRILSLDCSPGNAVCDYLSF